MLSDRRLPEEPGFRRWHKIVSVGADVVCSVAAFQMCGAKSHIVINFFVTFLFKRSAYCHGG